MPEGIPGNVPVLYQCLNDDICGAIFARPQTILLFGEYLDACPECHEDDFEALPSEVTSSLFWHIILHDYTQEEWDTYRMVVQSAMAPAIEPSDNDD